MSDRASMPDSYDEDLSREPEGDDDPFATFPLLIAVFCDTCGVEVRHDYLVHDLMTREQRLAVAREHLARNEGWSCAADGDFCPVHKPRAPAGESGD